VSILPTFRLPFLSRNKKYRTFQISGNSMLPIPDGAYVTGEFVQNWLSIHDRQPYIILTLDDGIVFKVVENRIAQEGKLRLYSLNPVYQPYDVVTNKAKKKTATTKMTEKKWFENEKRNDNDRKKI